ncbi:type II secretion system F family protein [uncultured Methanobrevibacter sp.]|uniref:type II secretion system F family protein n=1 Tax=uncultured Methanobrevibacter sp. TaxID=253161 RepID=UPI00263247E6|nr:type II secretion system F family protein [uncultured Methanobrevibacter sp.]
MFTDFFIIVADIFLNILNFFKNFNFENITFYKRNKSKKAVDPKLFIKLNFQEVKKENNSENKLFNKLRKIFLRYFLNKRLIFVEVSIFFVLFIAVGFEISGIYLTLIVMLYIFMLYFPKIQEKHTYDDLNFELPYGLRHMSTELKAGKGLHDTLLTISNANYGSLSKEFKRVLKEIKYGKSSEDALMEMSNRVSSEGLSRVVHQIVGTLRVGGNLANSLNVIADDLSFDMQIKLKEYSQKLNGFILIYTFVAILAPVIILIMLMAASTVVGDIISGDMVLIMYMFFFPLIVMFMGLFIKRMEPKI